MFSAPLDGGVISRRQCEPEKLMTAKRSETGPAVFDPNINSGMTNMNTTPGADPATSFVPRHIGPTPSDVAAMLELLGYDSLDALIDATVPAGIRLGRDRGVDPPVDVGARGTREVAQHRKAQPGHALILRAWLLRLHHTSGHPAQRVGESGLVHCLHAVSGGGRAGTTRGAVEFPDDGHGSHRSGDRQRVAARRGNRRRRSNGHGV